MVKDHAENEREEMHCCHLMGYPFWSTSIILQELCEAVAGTRNNSKGLPEKIAFSLSYI